MGARFSPSRAIALPAQTIVPLVRAGKLRPLAILSEKRHPQMPDVPTMAEVGFGDFQVSFWTGVVAAVGTSVAVVRRLNAVINDGLRSTDLQASLAKLDAEPRPGSPEEFAAFIAAQMRQWTDVVRIAGIKHE